MVVTATTRPDPASASLSPGELLFLLSYLGFAAFLLLDGRRPSDWSSALLVEAVVLTGGAASTAGILLFLPASHALGEAGLPLLVAMAYPAADVLLVLVLVAQVGLGRRPASPRTALLLCGLVLLTIGDAAFAQRLAAGQYQFEVRLVAVWTAAIALLVQGAVLPREPSAEQSARQRGLIMLPAVIAALVALALPLDPRVTPYLTIPALVTLLAVAARLILALREAQRATDAYRLSLVDDLTGLPNRRAILDRLEGAAHPTAVVVLEVESVRDVNYSLGYAAGDHLLQLVGARLASLAPADAVVARVEGPMFAVLQQGASDSRDALAAAHQLRSQLSEPLRLEGLELPLRVLAGVAVSSAEKPGGELLRQAHVAVRQARDTALGEVLFDPDDDLTSRTQLAQAEELRQALDAGELTAWYQPQVEAATMRLTGVEALVRWEHPTDGVRPPGMFLATARRAGLMARITELMTREAAGDAATWARGGNPLRVSINISPPELASGTVVPWCSHWWTTWPCPQGCSCSR